MLKEKLNKTEIYQDSVFLVSAKQPGCGSTTLANMLCKSLADMTDTNPHFISMGNLLRKDLNVKNESELANSLGKIPDPLEFDRKIYEGIPFDTLAVVEGKKATTMGPAILEGKRPTISIDLQASLLTSTVRVMKREGYRISDFIKSPEILLDYMTKIENRMGHLKKQNIGDLSKINRSNGFNFNTDLLSPNEILGNIIGRKDWLNTTPSWELEALRETLQTFYSISILSEIHPLDREHFNHSLSSVEYHVKRLKTNNNEYGLREVRKDIKEQLVNSAFALLMKSLPRFFSNNNRQNICIDNLSHKWSPEYYKVANAWPTIASIIKDKEILDPFAGSGTLMNAFAARNIPKNIVYGDLSYPGGSTLNGGKYSYEPVLNMAMANVLFDNLPSWYKPDIINKAKGIITLDAKNLPFADKSFDYVFSDPPYGKNLNDGSVEFFLSVLPEIKRVTKDGGIFFIPVQWIDDLNKQNIEYKKLTEDLSCGASHFPICLIKIYK